ncbi:MAG TPA: CDP-alcohol phosphatidyltransferase family protein [Gemmatimonadales bacterium]|nr:CDP-alcohol phosphatidyltransferase family protein [Gemmatimonadales bacterium]
MSEPSPPPMAEQGRAGVTLADLLTVSRLPMALAFVLVPSSGARLVILAAAAATDLLDGFIARRIGSSRFGSFLDPVADKLFMLCAFAVVVLSGRLAPFEVLAVLLRDVVASLAFAATLISGRPAAIPARVGGKAVTVGQILTLVAFLLDSPYLRPLAWATGAVGLYAIWDYQQVAATKRRSVGR